MTYIDGTVTPLKPRAEERLEQALGMLWQFREAGEDAAAGARDVVGKRLSDGVFEMLVERGFVSVAEGRWRFTEDGERLARDLTRRHRLAERLLADVLDIRGRELDSNACQWEHILSDEVARSICVLLGHPRVCPHGESIPEGVCCRGPKAALEPILRRLCDLEPGATGRVAYLTASDPGLLQRLLSLGLAPGADVRLRQSSPAVVVQIDANLAALETELAASIFVRTAAKG